VTTVTVAAVPDLHAGYMETKDNFLRFAVISSIVVVGLLALFVRIKA
jgi:hypothetical protein